jgi:asparagine synthase (glutamine-hydrolysing)
MVEDKLSMANGLETRVPFMDNDLVNFAMTCPVDLKVKNLFNRPRLDENHIGNKKESYFLQTSDGKNILREVMSGIIPPSITDGPKKGFSSPDASWFMNDSAGFVSKRLLAGDSGLLGLLDERVVSELVDSHLAGTENRRLLIWSLLTLDSLLRRKES